jgi:dephospho-CoA kinase
MYIPLIIGLPGVGKSSTARYLAALMHCNVIETDVLFRIYRGIPYNESLGVNEAEEIEGAEIMRRFIKRI